MFAPHPHRGPHPRLAARSAGMRPLAAVLAGLAAGLLALATPAFAMPVPVPGTEFRPSVPVPAPEIRTVSRTLVLGGMPGWQITLIALGAALAAAALAVLVSRAVSARRHTVPTAA